MGVGIDELELKKRSEKLAFMEVIDGKTSTYYRMEGFTDLGTSHNAKEYSRQYVDEDTERTNTTGYSESIGYKFDHYVGSPVLEEIVKITENELIGKDAVRNIVTVDMTTKSLSSGSNYTASATIRPYTIVPSSDGDSTDCMQYSGDFKSNGKKRSITVSSAKDGDWLKVTVSTTTSTSTSTSST
jgi:hypothetical protein